MHIRFEEVSVKATKHWKDAKGRHRQETRKFFQTLNPFNKNADGFMKSPQEIMTEICAERDAWLKDGRSRCGEEKIMSEALKAEIKRLYTLPCKCVCCGYCRGTGNIAVNYDAAGRVLDLGMYDDSYDLEPCDQCHGGISEVCDRCRDIEELEQELEEEEWRATRAAESVNRQRG